MPSSSLEVLNNYVLIHTEGDKTITDISQLLSRECFIAWLKTRSRTPKNPIHAFRKVITGHCRGDSGLKPFEKQVEKALVKRLRQKKVWACFENNESQIGCRGFTSLGYWEKENRKHTTMNKFRRDSVNMKIIENFQHYLNTKNSSLFLTLGKYCNIYAVLSLFNQQIGLKNFFKSKRKSKKSDDSFVLEGTLLLDTFSMSIFEQDVSSIKTMGELDGLTIFSLFEDYQYGLEQLCKVFNKLSEVDTVEETFIVKVGECRKKKICAKIRPHKELKGVFYFTIV